MIACVLPKKIKPCPMCGSKDISIYDIDYGFYSEYFIECNNCFLKGSKMFDLTSDFDVEKAVQTLINYWNNRPGVKQYTHEYNETEVKKLAEERNITEAKARYLIYQRDYGKEYRKKNKDRLYVYNKEYKIKNREEISQKSREKYLKKKGGTI